MFPPIPRRCIWACFFLLAFLFDGSLSAWAETSHGFGGVKVNRYPNMDAPGNDAKWVRGIGSVEECERLCLVDSACAGYTYNIKQSACIPKTEIGPLAPASDPAITGILERQSGGARVDAAGGSDGTKVRRYPNMDAPGNDAKWVCGTASLEQCENMCIADSACAGYTYNIKRSACFPKAAIGPLAPSSIPTVTGIVERQSGNRAIMVEGKPSFDCRKAKSKSAQAICGSTALIKLDVQLAKFFWAKMAKLKGSSADQEKRRQYDWGVARNQCGADAACVEQSYQRRIAELGGPTVAAAASPSQTQPPAVQPVAEQKPQPEAEPERKEFRATVQQLPNPIRLIGQADQPCNVASATLARLRKTLSVSVPDGLTVQAEHLRSSTWKTSRAPPLGPAYLVFAADAPVRVQGAGFYALTPEAKAPFRIKQFLKDTRVIIPLHVKGAPQSGDIKIRPLIAGPLKVSAAIIGYTQCGENPDPAPIAFDLTAEPGAPEIVIADRFDLAKPDQIIASPDGTRRIEIYGPRYRLIDVVTGAQLADEVGKEPHFSSTGRFLVATVKKNFAIIDSAMDPRSGTT
jgi:PAN domain